MSSGIVCLSELIGRNNDYLVDGKGEKLFLSGTIDVHYLKCGKKIQQWQMQQDEKGKLLFRIVASQDWTDSDEAEIRRLLVVKNIEPSFEYPKEIAYTARGKQKTLIQNIRE